MKTISTPNRILLLLTILMAAYQIAVGIDGLDRIAVTCYTISFGVLLVACLLLIIFGYEILQSSLVVIVSTIIPLTLSLGLIWEYWQPIRTLYLVFSILGFFAVVISRRFFPDSVAVILLALVHGVSGMVIFLLPILLTMNGETNPGFALIGIGGALIGIGGLLLSFLRTGRPILSRDTILSIFPALLLLMTTAFILGFLLR
ncbi:MAG: hypothetical protein JSV42_06525 [Chloroflexota bacterium]|nr:MAG: hypothetical protein JSV42_06525 [Chloroflexota bacterium]